MRSSCTVTGPCWRKVTSSTGQNKPACWRWSRTREVAPSTPEVSHRNYLPTSETSVLEFHKACTIVISQETVKDPFHQRDHGPSSAEQSCLQCFDGLLSIKGVSCPKWAWGNPFRIVDGRIIFVITARKRSLGRLCFYTCLSFCAGGEGVLPQCMLEYTPPGANIPPAQCMLGDTDNKRAVRTFWNAHLFFLSLTISANDYTNLTKNFDMIFCYSYKW